MPTPKQFVIPSCLYYFGRRCQCVYSRAAKPCEDCFYPAPRAAYELQELTRVYQKWIHLPTVNNLRFHSRPREEAAADWHKYCTEHYGITERLMNVPKKLSFEEACALILGE